MPLTSRVWAVRLAIFFITCLGVFVLPFLFSAPYFEGVSASNLAGFNNRVAALAAAGMASLVFLISLRWPGLAGFDGIEQEGDGERISEECGRLPRSLVGVVILFWGASILLAGILVIRFQMRYPFDWGYFINRISMHADFGLKLYTQIEFPYGPVLFYGPIIVREILSPFHISAAGAYMVTLFLEIVIGVLLVAYVIDYLPLSRRWKIAIFLLLAVGMAPVNLGLNYTFFRFGPPLAFLVMASQRRRPWAAALWIFAGQAVCLGLSPEIGFGFFVGSFAYGLLCCFTKGWGWLLVVAAPIPSTAAFLLVVGQPYLRMLGMYSHGVMSFPVEPLPHIVVFVFALVWLVPVGLANFFRKRRPEAPILAALYLVSVALLPAALGRADPWHVYWNGLSVFLLSIVAVSSKRMWQQVAWGSCLAMMFLWTCNVDRRVYWSVEVSPLVHRVVASCRNAIRGGEPVVEHPGETDFDMQKLQEIVGRDPVATPEDIPLPVEKSLRESKQYTPSFYFFQTAILDRAGEERDIKEFNYSKWALIPKDYSYQYAELPEDLKYALGFRLRYRTRRPVYTIGLRFAKNLADNWQVRGSIGRYLVYEHL